MLFRSDTNSSGGLIPQFLDTSGPGLAASNVESIWGGKADKSTWFCVSDRSKQLCALTVISVISVCSVMLLSLLVASLARLFLAASPPLSKLFARVFVVDILEGVASLGTLLALQ